MAKDFFGSLTDTFAKVAKDLTGRAETIYETQKLKNKISGEKQQIEKAMADLGRIVYRRYQEGISVEEAEDAICVQIDERYQQIKRLKKEAEELKEQRVCPNCGSIVGRKRCILFQMWCKLSGSGRRGRQHCRYGRTGRRSF